MKENRSLILVIGGVLFLGVIALFLFWNNKAVQPAEEDVVSGPVKEFSVDGSSFEFDPKTITVKKGDTVKITFKDIDSRHNLVIDGYGVSTDLIDKGKEDTIQFVADKTGSFEYYCSVANHEELGMTGILVVGEK